MTSRVHLVASSFVIAFVAACAAKPTPKPQVAEAEPTAAEDTPDTSTLASKRVVEDPEIRQALVSLSRVHFKLNSEELLEKSKADLDAAAVVLQKHSNLKLQVEGNADERGSTEYNLGLGERRAQAVKRYLTYRGVDPNNLTVISYGEERPLSRQSSPAALAANRRVDFKLLDGAVELVLEEGALYDDDGQALTTAE